MTNHATFRVSCKAVLYNPARTKVLVANYGQDMSPGLLGGHIEESEEPDQAMQRELFEELGLRDVQLKPAGFAKNHDGKIVLFFVGVIGEDSKIAVNQVEMNGVDWVLLEDIRTKKVDIRNYHDAVLDNFALSI